MCFLDNVAISSLLMHRCKIEAASLMGKLSSSGKRVFKNGKENLIGLIEAIFLT
jgi:hypothetical protein